MASWTGWTTLSRRRRACAKRPIVSAGHAWLSVVYRWWQGVKPQICVHAVLGKVESSKPAAKNGSKAGTKTGTKVETKVSVPEVRMIACCNS